MDWELAIKRNRAALKRVLAMLVAMAGFATGPHPEAPGVAGHAGGPHPEVRAEGEPRRTLPRRLHRAILRLLRPAESAARRLVIVFARNMVITLPPLRPRRPQPNPTILRDGVGTGIVLPPHLSPTRPAPRALSLPLADPLRRPNRQRRSAATGCVPRILFPGFAAPAPFPVRPTPHDLIDAKRLVLRLAALASALDDLPSHAKRFARWRARRDAGRIRRTSPLRASRPPGQRSAGSRQPAHEIHDALNDIHGLAFQVLEPVDTS